MLRRWAVAAWVCAAACTSSDAARPDAAGTDASGPVDGAIASDAGAGSGGTDEGCGDAGDCLEHRHATWPMTNPGSTPLPNAATWTVGAESAIESVTGLEWQRAFTPKRTWADAIDTCASLVAAGHDDWRLPSRIELVSLVDFTRRPTIDAAGFEGTPEDYFWASTKVAFDVASTDTLAWSVYFGAGLSAYGARADATGHVRCVRAGRVVSRQRWELTADEALDPSTGLRWQRAHHPDRLAWQAANDVCAAVPGGAWRLPSQKEAQTVVDETRAAPAVDPAVFPAAPDGKFWTSTLTNRANPSEAIYLDLHDGAIEEASKLDELWVRCVR